MRFVLRYERGGAPPEADVARVRALPGAVIVDASSNMLLVEAEPEPLRQVVDGLDGWAMAPERQYQVPDGRPRVEGPS
jgi:hypothetical protein